MKTIPDSKIHGANMGPTWVLSAPGGPHVGPMNLVVRDLFRYRDYHLKVPIIKIQDCFIFTMGILMLYHLIDLAPWEPFQYNDTVIRHNGISCDDKTTFLNTLWLIDAIWHHGLWLLLHHLLHRSWKGDILVSCCPSVYLSIHPSVDGIMSTL